MRGSVAVAGVGLAGCGEAPGWTEMEIPVPAPAAGVLEALHVAEGDAVEEGQHVATLRA